MNILFIGDIIGRPGRAAVKKHLTEIKKKYAVDAVIANGENLASGFGMTEDTYNEMREAGIDLFTSGNHIWDRKEFVPLLNHKETRVVRPANYPKGVTGRGFDVVSVGEKKLFVVNISGRSFMREHYDSPFTTMETILALPEARGADAILVDHHAETTAEKNFIGYWLDGKVSAIVGTHTHVQTADERILPKGTAYITDVGMTGPLHSSIGMDLENVTRWHMYQTPVPLEVAGGPVVLSAVVIKGAERSKAASITRIYQES